MEAIEGSSYDAYVGMVVSDAIEHSRDDNFINECEWLERHGFIRTISLDNVCFKNQHFKICDQYYSVMVSTGAMNNLLRCMSQGEWIWQGNLSLTQAVLMPEQQTDLDYDPANYTALKYISENGLQDAFAEWKQSCETLDDDDEVNALNYLVASKDYPRYLWWSRKGPGIYRYVGWGVMKDYSWKGAQFDD